MTIEQKRKERRKVTGEDFTPPELVKEMLNKLPKKLFLEPERTFCDPAAGNGNFLVEILEHKMLNGHGPLQALKTIYGVELMEDNVEEMKLRLLEQIPSRLREKAKVIVDTNIVCHDAFTWDFENWCEKGDKK